MCGVPVRWTHVRASRGHRRRDFEQRILAAFTDGIRDRPDTTFGNVKADVLARFVPGFVRTDFVTTILESPWED